MSGPYDLTWAQWFWVIGTIWAVLAVIGLVIWFRGRRR